MPYIKQNTRETLNSDTVVPANAGELNYKITTKIFQYFEANGGTYQQVNDILGALEGAKLEFYRRVVAPYEDFKMKENGDVY